GPCGERVVNDIADEIRDILVFHLGCEEERLIDDARLTADLGADSLDIVEVMMDVSRSRTDACSGNYLRCRCIDDRIWRLAGKNGSKRNGCVLTAACCMRRATSHLGVASWHLSVLVLLATAAEPLCKSLQTAAGCQRTTTCDGAGDGTDQRASRDHSRRETPHFGRPNQPVSSRP